MPQYIDVTTGRPLAPIEFPLTKKQRKLVDTLVTSRLSITDAAVTAGYANGIKCEAGRCAASKALRLPHVVAYMMQETSAAMGVDAARARQSIATMSSEARSEYVKFLASKDILDRTGFKPPEKHVHEHGQLDVNIRLDK